jgi:four helix bundle protein
VKEERMKNGEDLKVRTKKYARRIIRLFLALPKNSVTQVLGKQMLRSGTSVGANYCEANRARSKAEFIAKIGDCLREIDETAYWLELLVDEKFVTSEKLANLLDETDQLTAIFVTILKNAKSG